MDTQTLEHYLNLLNAQASKSHLVGVYASDRLPRRFNRPAAIIAHTETASEKYGHWVAIYVPSKGIPSYFDSFGIDAHISNHKSFLERLSKFYKFSTICYQSPTSTVCGWHALLYLADKMGVIKKGFFERLMAKSKGNLDENDKIVEQCGKWLVADLKGVGDGSGDDKKGEFLH
jgi:hypothetical protein